jgi:hypothetical protein
MAVVLGACFNIQWLFSLTLTSRACFTHTPIQDIRPIVFKEECRRLNYDRSITFLIVMHQQLVAAPLVSALEGRDISTAILYVVAWTASIPGDLAASLRNSPAWRRHVEFALGTVGLRVRRKTAVIINTFRPFSPYASVSRHIGTNYHY